MTPATLPTVDPDAFPTAGLGEAYLAPQNGDHAVVVPAWGDGYVFPAAFPPGHLVADFMRYAAERTDAAHDYHEVGGLILIAQATPGVRATLAPYPAGLPTNLYAIILGDSTTSRKSTSRKLMQDIQACVDPGSLMPDAGSPEGFVEQLARRNGRGSLWAVDEFADLLDRLSRQKYMAGLRGLLLTVYDGSAYRAHRHSKRRGKGTAQTTEEDHDLVEEPYLSILGAATPGLFDRLEPADVTSGLLARFAIIMPTTKPERRPFFELTGALRESQAAVVGRLHRLLAWATDGPRRPVVFTASALQAIDQYAEAMERRSADVDEAARALLQRLVPMALKVSMLAAAGRPETPDHDHLAVDLDAARQALTVIGRWEAYALAFADRIGEGTFERQLRRCARVTEAKGRLPRRFVARAVHLDKRMMDLVEATLVDRGQIKVHVTPSSSGPSTSEWEWLK